MKKLYVLACTALLASSAFAQKAGVTKAAEFKERDARMEDSQVQPAQMGDRDIFWMNDFSEPADWLIQNTGDVGVSGFVTDLDFEIGTGLEPEGPAAIDPIESTTYDNGMAMVDSDEYGGEEGGVGIENCWFQNVDPIDCSEQPTVALFFETYYRMWDNGNSDGNEYCLVEVSTDGTTWPDVTTYEVADAPAGTRYELWPDMSTQDPVNNPTNIFFDLSSIAAGEETVYLRFRWKGTFGYAWMIDDISLQDLPDNSLGLANVTYSDYDNTGEYEMGVYTPENQTDLNFRADVLNLGAADQLGVTMSVNIDGSEVAVSPATDVLYGETDSLLAGPYAVPTALGDYEIEYMLNMDSVDFDPEDNMAMQSFEVNEWQMGRDDGTFETFFPGADYVGEWRGGPLYTIFEDATVYALDVCLWQTTLAGADITGYIMDPDAEAIDDEDVFASSDELAIEQFMVNTLDDEDEPYWLTLPLTEEFQVFEGDIIHATVGSFSGGDVSILAAPNTYDFSNYVYGDLGTGGVTWYWTERNLLVRLNFNPNATTGIADPVAANNFTLNQNFPNPATANTRIGFNLESAGDVTFELYDITGKIVMTEDKGTLPAGEHVMDIDVSNYNAGVYQYSVIVNGERVTRPMMVK